MSILQKSQEAGKQSEEEKKQNIAKTPEAPELQSQLKENEYAMKDEYKALN